MAPATGARGAAAAAAAAVAAAAKDENDPTAAKLAVWKDALYDKVRESGRENDLFTQDNLMDLGVIPNGDKGLLLRVVQALSDDKLFVTMREASGNVFWKWRDAQEAHKYKQCTSDEQIMVYSLIDDSGGDGIWSQTLQRRLNMHDTVLKNAIKQLQAKGLIVPFKNVEHPNKKMFIKASIQPSDRATGGPWYTDQNLDEAFIEELQRVIFDYVKRQSTYVSRNHTPSPASAPTPASAPAPAPAKNGTSANGTAAGRKRDAKEMMATDTPAAPASKLAKTATQQQQRKDVLLPLPAGYKGYPTVRDIARLLSASGITNNTILSEQDVKKLVDVLVWDNLVEPVKVAGKIGFRVSRVAKQSTESWAGRDDTSVAGRDVKSEPYVSPYSDHQDTPVFDLYEEGAAVGPSNCVYYTRWYGRID
ncbi:hypothetical protein GMORB2_3844 [Geosmithia morbida]|uniref:DNA-directed RNA polymerase III subunit RPC6 n=1 Tax=Geosmithia morbida TaxID=1094350 RepID=A0A9P4YZN4_9HYPO|nr:uncharacterized protein GMORB2_3844 [Geosmithia morbida]KAF4125005.1 hypothetical protein GMORB2_3844 [Geosmithia morbida]